MEGQATEGREKIFTEYISNDILVSRAWEAPLKFNTEKTNSLIKNGLFTKEDVQIAESA